MIEDNLTSNYSSRLCKIVKSIVAFYILQKEKISVFPFIRPLQNVICNGMTEKI